MNIDPIRPYFNAIKIIMVVLILVGVWMNGYDKGRDKWQGKFDIVTAEHKAAKASHKATIDNLAALTKAAANKARAASEQAHADRKANDKRYKEKQHEADKAKHDLADALRRGSVRLRDEWTCPATGPAEGGTSAASRRQDANAGLRATREGAILDDIADHDEADNWIGWLQTELTSTRQACGVTP